MHTSAALDVAHDSMPLPVALPVPRARAPWRARAEPVAQGAVVHALPCWRRCAAGQLRAHTPSRPCARVCGCVGVRVCGRMCGAARPVREQGAEGADSGSKHRG